MTEPMDAASTGAAEPVRLAHQAPDPLTYQPCPNGCGTQVALVETTMATPGEPIEQTPVTGWFENVGTRVDPIADDVTIDVVVYREHTTALCEAAAAGDPIPDDDPDVTIAAEVPVALAEAARRMAALGDVLAGIDGNAASDEVEVCRDIARALVEPTFRNEYMTDEVFARIAAAILGEVTPQ